MAGKRIYYSKTLYIAVHGALLSALPVQADDRWGGSVGVTTDYIYRGISQSRGESALQGGLQLQLAPGWSVGAWGSTVDFAGATYEIDLHAARSWSLGPDWSAQLGFVHYEYPNDAFIDYDYDEATASLSFQQRITASVSWSPNTTRWGWKMPARGRRALSYELTLLEPLGPHWSLCAGAGHYDLRDLFGTGYWFWNAGLSFTWDALQIDLLHIGTDATAQRLFGYETTRSRWTAALSWRF